MLVHTSAYTAVSVDCKEVLFKTDYSILGYQCSQTAKFHGFLYSWSSHLTLLKMLHLYFCKMAPVSSHLNFLVLITLSSTSHGFFSHSVLFVTEYTIKIANSHAK